ncbi:MAG: hypothetical protein ABL930_08050, partial [Pseudobdellovibrio sp.]
AWNVIKDSIAPTLSSSSPENNSTIYTNSLPLSVPVNLQFSENLTSISINGVSQPTFTNSYSTNYYISSAGQNQLQILAQDRAGNIGNITHTVNVQYSNADLSLTLAEDSIDILTNKISTPLSGTASEKLKSISINGQLGTIGSDGKSFSYIFNAPADGLHHLVFTGTDIYGNVGTTDTYVRVHSNMPDGIEGYKGPTGDYNRPGYDINPGNIFNPDPGGDLCNSLDGILSGLDNLRTLSESELGGYIPKNFSHAVPDVDDVERFYKKHIDRDPINRTKAGYLMACKGFDLLASKDCAKNRTYFKYLMGQYPEPFIIRKIPGLPIIVQNFLIKRWNICTGLDTSELGCKDLLVFAPFIADFVVPGSGQVVGSPLGQFIMETYFCSELCAKVEFKFTPLCQEVALPEFPPIPKFGGPRISFPGGGSGSDWGPGGDWPGGGGGSCGGWFQPSCPGNGDNNGNPDGVGRDYICSVVPSLWLCHPNNPIGSGTVTITPITECNPNWTVSDIINLYPSSPSLAWTNYISSCSTDGVPYIPDNKKPILTVTAPTQNQVVDEATVRVTGLVDDITSKVKIEGVIVETTIGAGGVHFDVTIPVPADRKISVEASDASGNLADSVEIDLTMTNTNRIYDVKQIKSLGDQTCVIMGENNELKCWNMSSRDNLYSYPGLQTGVTSISLGVSFSCAVKNGEVYCWGSNTWGAFGYPSTVTPTSVLPVKNPYLSDIQKIQVTQTGLCALNNAGEVKCAGLYDEGSLGDGFHAVPGYSVYQPVNVAGFDAPVVDLMGTLINSFFCAKQNNNKILCWGNGSTHLSYIAQVINGNPIQNATSMSAFYRNLCFVKDSKQYCMGYNNPSLPMLPGGVVGDYGPNPELKDFIVFPREMLNVTNVRKHVIGSDHMCILQTTGSVKCWGHNEQKQIGTFADSYTEDIIGVENLVLIAHDISAGGAYTCVVVGTSKTVQCWGSGSAEVIDIN